MSKLLEKLYWKIRVKLLVWKVKRGGRQLSPEGCRMKRYMEGIKDGSVNYTIAKFDEMIENFRAERDVSKEEAIDMLIVAMDLLS